MTRITPPIAVVFGATGFVGSRIVAQLARAGWIVRAASRKAQRADRLRVLGPVGQVVPFGVDYEDEDSLSHAICGADAVIVSLGVLHQRGKNSFKRLHVDIPARIAGLCSEAGVPRLVHISALACERGSSQYAQSKLAGETLVKSLFPNVTILRPSVIFGEGDGLFAMTAELMRYLPFLPLIGGGHTKFQPVSVEDVAKAAVAAIAHPGQTYELVGPDVMSLRDIMEYVRHLTRRTTLLIPLPFWYATIKAFFLGLLPKPMLTMDAVESLKTDNIPGGTLPGLEALGITATPVETIVPGYLARFRVGGSHD